VTIPRCLGICLVAALITMVNLVFGQTAAPGQQTAQPPAQHTEYQAPPTRAPNTAGYVVAKEVLPLVELQAHVKLTKDPEGRATMGGSSEGSGALIMAWYHPDWYHRVLTYSGTFVNQPWPRQRARQLANTSVSQGPSKALLPCYGACCRACCFWLYRSNHASRGQISFQCPHSSRERGIGLDESSPTSVENRMGQLTDFFHMTTAKIGIHMLEHADRIPARFSSIAIGGKPIVKAIGDRPQQWQG
jgi:Putative esterase